MDGILKLDPKVLDNIAQAIKNYCKAQSETISEYLSKMNSISRDWVDDLTMGKLLKEISIIQNIINTLSIEIVKTYPPYFLQKADMIKNRPMA